MNSKGDRRTFTNEDLVLKVNEDVDPNVWDESKYEAFVDELCGFREYQKDAIRTSLRFLLGKKYPDLRALAEENFEANDELKERYGSWTNMDRHLQFPDKLSCTLDQATATGKSYVMYGLAMIMLAEGAVDRALVLCPSNTIEDGLLKKFRELASKRDLIDTLPASARLKVPKIINASESIVEGSICVENYHAILESVRSSIRESIKRKGERVLILNDEAHHVAVEAGATVRRWKEFLQSPDFNFRYIVGVSGTCYVNDDYFSDVIHRYSLRQAIEQNVVKKVEYVDELPEAAEQPEDKWQLIYNRHEYWKKNLKSRKIRPLTIVVTKGIADAERVAEELQEFLVEWEGIAAQKAKAKVLCVTSSPKHQTSLSLLKGVDNAASKVEWIVSVSMLSEGWDVKNVFQIVPHEERAFNSKLLISQVLGRGLRKPEGWRGEEPVVTVFNHDAWSGRIKHLVNEILEIERRLTSSTIADSTFNFDLHQLDYNRLEDATEYTKKGEYTLFGDGYIDLPTQIEREDVVIQFARAVTGEHSKFKTKIEHKTWSIEEVAEQMYQRLKSIDDESRGEKKAADRTNYAKRFPVKKCEAIIELSLKKAKIRSGRVTDDNRQKFLQALGPLRRKSAKRVIYKLAPKALVMMNSNERQDESCSAAELRRGSKTVFYCTGCEKTLLDEQREFFAQVDDEDGGFGNGKVKLPNAHDFKTPVNIAFADGNPERAFIRELTRRDNATQFDAWLKNTSIGFYTIEYAWKKGEHPKRGEFSPDFFIKQGNSIFVVEIKGNEEIDEPSPDNIKKHEYAVAHFKRLNEWLSKERIKTRYQFNMLSPKNYNAFFQKLRDADLRGFRSELDVEMSKAAKSTG